MKELLKDFYNIDVDDYYEVEEGYILYIDNNVFYLYRLDSECNIDVIKEIYNYVIGRIKLHTIVNNIFNEYVSDGYILMKVNVLICDIDFNDVFKFGRCNMNELSKYYLDIRSYWINKLDNLEKNINNYNDDVRYDFYYYMGVIERLICYMDVIDITKLNLVLSHKKRYNNTIDYYNPFNLCIDLYYRDLLFYLYNNEELDNLYKYIGNINDYDRKYILFSLLIPYDYFYNIDRYVSNIVDYEDYVSYVLDILGYKKRSN